MTASARRTVIVSVAAIGVAVVLVWAAASQPPRIVGDRHAPTADTDSAPAPTPSPTSDAPPTFGSDSTTAVTHRDSWVDDLATFLLLLLVVWLVWLLGRSLLNGVRRWLPEPQLVLDLEPLPDVVLARQALGRDRDRQLGMLAGDDVRNGIVACWVLLEETASEAGVTRAPAETSTEFVMRFLHTLDVDPRPVAALAGLYREARFSTHAMAADSRARAEEALVGIHRDLEDAGAAR